MMETIVTSSVLILILVALRHLLRGKLSTRLQYALWLLVAIRLLLPFSLFNSPISVMSVFPASTFTSSFTEPSTAPTAPTTAPFGQPLVVEGTSAEALNTEVKTDLTHRIDFGTLATSIWLLGMLVTGTLFLTANVRLFKKLRKDRKPIHLPGCRLPVYLTKSLSSPCLYGVGKPSIYLTPECLNNEERAAHVIAHENTHFRHGDFLWSVVRALCVCIHWYNPLVWLTASLSRKDSELACDEGTLLRLGDKTRSAYGKTLIEMMTSSHNTADIFTCATTMSGRTGEITERIRRIAKRPKTKALTLFTVLVIAIVAIASTFSGTNHVKLTSIAGTFAPSSLDRVVYGTLFSEDRVADLSTSQAQEMAAFLKDLEVGKEEVSMNRGGNRDSIHQIRLAFTGFLDDGTILDVWFNFSSDYSVVWVDNTIKPSLSYRVKSPRSVKSLFTKRFSDNTTTVQIGSAEALWEERTPYIGNNSAVSNLVNLLPVPEDLTYQSLKLHTDTTPYAVEVMYSASPEVLSKYETNGLSEYPPLPNNALVLLALIDNADQVITTITAETQKASFVLGREWAEDTLGVNIREHAESPESVQELMDLSVIRLLD